MFSKSCGSRPRIPFHPPYINSFIHPFAFQADTIAASTKRKRHNLECNTTCVLCFQFSARPDRMQDFLWRGWSWDCPFWSPFVNRTAFNYARFGAVYINRRACKEKSRPLCVTWWSSSGDRERATWLRALFWIRRKGRGDAWLEIKNRKRTKERNEGDEKNCTRLVFSLGRDLD